MRLRIRTALICGFMVALFSSPAILSSAPTELLLGDVDQIFIHAYVDRDGMLWIKLNYESREKGQSVYWTGGRVDCNCTVYEYEDKGANDDEKKGRRITKVSDTIFSVIDKLSVDIPEKYLGKGKRGIVECSFNTGSEKLKAQDYVRLSYGPSRSHFGGDGDDKRELMKRKRDRGR